MATPAACLSPEDVETVRGALKATVEGSFFPEWEFETLIGSNRETVRRVYHQWPTADETDEDVVSVVIGSLNNLLGYPHRKYDELSTYVSGGQGAIKRSLNNLIALGW